MRVITGTARGMRLHVPGGTLRPTMDRVREAIFSSLGEAVVGARVLDLFAGSGALGIEALSRGAAQATFVDSDWRVAACIQTNLSRAGLSGKILTLDAFRYLEVGADRRDTYDLIFADPPYARPGGGVDVAAALANHPGTPTLLASGGTLILECGIHPAEVHPALEVLRDRRYGKSRILYLVHSRP